MARKSGRWRVPQGFDSGMRRDRSNGLKSRAARRLENRKSPEKRELKFDLARELGSQRRSRVQASKQVKRPNI